MIIAVDAFGGDNAPQAIIEGVAKASLATDTKFVLTGDKSVMESILEKLPHNRETISFFHAPEVIGPEEHPVPAIKEKKNSSSVAALEMVGNHEADVAISAGSTGALLVGSVKYVNRLSGVLRPALATVLPGTNGPVILMDSGANVDVRLGCFADFARMGMAYVTEVLHEKEAKVGLLNIGTEDAKGNKQCKEAFAFLKEQTDIPFVGNIEARDVLNGDINVVLADGFAGNICLKTLEGTALTIISMLKDTFKSSVFGLLAAFLIRNKMKLLKKKLSLDENGGAPLLGLNGVVVKAHGSSKAHSIEVAIAQTEEMVRTGLVEKIRQNIQTHLAKDNA